MPIHDRVYRRLDDPPKKPHPFPAAVIGRYGLRYSVRGWFVRLLLLAGCIPALVFCGQVYAASRMENGEGILRLLADFSGQGVGSAARTLAGLEDVDPESWRNLGEVGLFLLLFIQTWVITALTPLIGGRAIADDLRSQAFEVYLARPITGVDYLLGKFLGVFQLLFALAVLPGVVLLAVSHGLFPESWSATWPLYFKVLLAGSIIAAVNGFIVLGISSVGTSRRYAVIIWYLLTFGSTMLQGSLFAATGDGTFDTVGYVTNQHLFLLGAIGADLPEGLQNTYSFVTLEPNTWLHLGVLGALSGLGALLVLRRVNAGRRP